MKKIFIDFATIASAVGLVLVAGIAVLTSASLRLMVMLAIPTAVAFAIYMTITGSW